MKIQLGELRGLAQGLTSILEERLPAKVAYWLARNGDKLDQELKAFEKTRIATVEKYCNQDKEGKPVIKDNEYQFDNRQEFDTEISKLMEEDIEIDLKTIPLGDLADVKLKTLDMIRLQKIIKEDG